MTRYNKSKMMKLAHHMRKSEGLTMSQSLTLAWSKAKRSEYYLIVEVRKPIISNRNITMSQAQVDICYTSGAYSGD